MAAIIRATVPTVEQNVTAGFQGPSVGIGDEAARALGQLGQAVEGAGAAMSKIHADMEMRADADAVTRAGTELKQFTLEQQRSARETLGVNARGMSDRMASDYKKKSDDIAGKLTPRQRTAFQRDATELGLQHTNMLATHEQQQNRIALEGAASANIEMSRNLAASNINDPAAIAKGLGDIRAQLAGVAQLNGWDDARLKAETEKQISAAHIAVLDNMLAQDAQLAKGYYAATRGEIDPHARPQIEKTLKLAGARETGQAWADKVDYRKMSESEALAKTREKFGSADAETREQAVNAVKTRYDEQKQADRKVETDAADTAWGIYARTHKLSDIPAAVLTAMDGHEREQLQNYARERAEGIKQKTDPESYGRLMMMATTRTDEFIKYDLRKEYPQLSDMHKFQLHQIQAELAGKAGKAGKPLKNLQTMQQQLSQTFSELGWGGLSNQEKRGQLSSHVTDQVMAMRNELGRDLRDEEVRTIIDNSLAKQSVEGAGWFGRAADVAEYQLDSDKEIDAFTPSQERLELFAAELTRRRKDVGPDGQPFVYHWNDSNVLATYRSALKRQLQRRKARAQ